MNLCALRNKNKVRGNTREAGTGEKTLQSARKKWKNEKEREKKKGFNLAEHFLRTGISVSFLFKPAFILSWPKSLQKSAETKT